MFVKVNGRYVELQEGRAQRFFKELILACCGALIWLSLIVIAVMSWLAYEYSVKALFLNIQEMIFR